MSIAEPIESSRVERRGKTRHDTARHNTTRHDTTPHDTTRHDTTRHETTRHGTAQHGTARHGTARCVTSPHVTSCHGTLLCDIVDQEKNHLRIQPRPMFQRNSPSPRAAASCSPDLCPGLQPPVHLPRAQRAQAEHYGSRSSSGSSRGRCEGKGKHRMQTERQRRPWRW